MRRQLQTATGPGTVPMVAIAVSITVPALIAIFIEAARAAGALVTNPATYALDFLDDARLVLRQSSSGRAREADRVRAVGQQRRAQSGGGGGVCAFKACALSSIDEFP
jgi:hypothetical protein